MRQQLEQERIDGEAARQLLNNPIFKRLWQEAEQDILAQMQAVEMRDTDMHTKLIFALKIFHQMKRHVERTLETGEMATLQLNEPNKHKAFGR